MKPWSGFSNRRRSLSLKDWEYFYSTPAQYFRFPQQFAGSHLYSWVERDTVRIKCRVHERNTMSPATACSSNKRSNHEAEINSCEKQFVASLNGNLANFNVQYFLVKNPLDIFFTFEFISTHHFQMEHGNKASAILAIII